MRILHFSDLHIGVESYGRPASEKDLLALPEWFAPGENRENFLGYSTRLLDFLAAFDELIAHALNNDVDLVLFSGDAYKSREPSQTHQREFAKRVARLANAGVPVFLLVGNHDLPHAAYKATAVEIFETLGVRNVTVGDRLAVYPIETRRGPLQVLAMPWIRRSTFIARDDVRNLPYTVINELLEERLTAALADHGASLDPSIPSVLSAHVSVNTAKLGSERTMMMGYDHMLMQSNLTALPVDYIGLGHIHRKQQLSDAPAMVYPGSLQRVDFGEEEHEAKGFYIVDLDPQAKRGNRLASADFHKVAARSFVTVSATVQEQDDDPTGVVLAATKRSNVQEAIVRVQVKTPARHAAALREREIRQALEEHGAHTVTSISRDVEREVRTRLSGLPTESREPLELLQFYLESKEVPEARRRTLLAYARRLLEKHQEREEQKTPSQP